ncbi:MAG: L7Ae/L30e/S12e/Gadd45 family ribosomal protein [Gemmatimonadales bacterium]
MSGGIIGLLGLGLRAGNVLVGVEAVRRALQAAECRCVVVASDASQRALEKVARLATAKGIPQLAGPTAQEMGARLGKPPIMVVGVRDSELANGLIRLAGEQGSMEV